VRAGGRIVEDMRYRILRATALYGLV